MKKLTEQELLHHAKEIRAELATMTEEEMAEALAEPEPDHNDPLVRLLRRAYVEGLIDPAISDTIETTRGKEKEL